MANKYQMDSDVNILHFILAGIACTSKIHYSFVYFFTFLSKLVNS